MTEVNICCEGMKKFRKRFLYYDVGNLFAGMPKGSVGLFSDGSMNGPPLPVKYCPFCRKKLREEK